MRAKNVQRSSRRPAKSVESSVEIRNRIRRNSPTTCRDQRARAKAGDAVGVVTLEPDDALAVELDAAGVACTRSASVSGAKAPCAAPTVSGVERAIASKLLVGSAETSAGSRATRICSNTSFVISASERLSEI